MNADNHPIIRSIMYKKVIRHSFNGTKSFHFISQTCDTLLEQRYVTVPRLTNQFVSGTKALEEWFGYCNINGLFSVPRFLNEGWTEGLQNKASSHQLTHSKTNCLFGFCHDSCLTMFRLGQLPSVLFRIDKMLWKKIYTGWRTFFFFLKHTLKLDCFASMIGCHCFGEGSRVWLFTEAWYCLMSIFVYGAVITSWRRLELETVSAGLYWKPLASYRCSGSGELSNHYFQMWPFALLIINVFLWRHDLWQCSLSSLLLGFGFVFFPLRHVF